MNQTTAIRARGRLVRGARDFAIGLAVYAFIVAGVGYLSAGTIDPDYLFSSKAHAAMHGVAFAKFEADQIATTATDARQATIILGLAFATLTAFNLAFLRHLRRVYASPR